MNIELDSFPLILTGQDKTGKAADIRNVSNIRTTENLIKAEKTPPGLDAGASQNLGRSAVKISFDGTFQGKTAMNNLEMIRSKFKGGKPLPFNSDVSGATDVTKVIIDVFRIEEAAGRSDLYKYSMELSEFKEPPPQPTTPPSQIGKAKTFAANASQNALDGINYLTGKVLDAEGKPKSGVKVLATSKQGEFQGQTNEEGIYRIEDLPPDEYRVTVDAEGYEGVEETVTIGKGAI